MTSCDVASNSCQALGGGGGGGGGGGLAALHTRGAIMEYVRNVEAFVLTQLQDGSNFQLAPGERVHSAAAYNHVVRCSGERGRPQKGQPSHPAGDHVINEVHSDFTRASGMGLHSSTFQLNLSRF